MEDLLAALLTEYIPILSEVLSGQFDKRESTKNDRAISINLFI